MKKEIKLKQAVAVPIIPQSEPEEGKKWSYSFVYYLEDLRNIYRLYDENEIDSISTLLRICKEKEVKSWSGKEWNLRNLLEQVNLELVKRWIRSHTAKSGWKSLFVRRIVILKVVRVGSVCLYRLEGRGGGGQGCPIPFLFLNSSE